MCTDGLVQLLMMLAKPRTKLIRTNRNAYYKSIRLMLPKVSEPLLNQIFCINLDKLHVNCINVAEIRKQNTDWNYSVHCTVNN